MLDALKFLQDKVYGSELKLDDSYKELNSSVNGCVTAVDGGCCIIADGGSWIISKIKVASVHYDQGKRNVKQEGLQEYYYTIIKDDNQYVHSMTDLRCDFKNVQELSEVPSVIMRTLEFKHAYELVKELPEESLIIIDGLLKAETPDQEKGLRLLEHEAKKKNINVVGLAKTFRQSINGRSVIGTLLSNRPDGKWVYDYGDQHVVKLHDKARYAYALSAFKHTRLEQVMPVLIYYSRDPSLVGYPYPLLKVDKDARISGHEKNLLINRFKIICQKQGLDFIEYDQKSTSMHSVMDSQKYR